jgi:Transposase IS116/IS110/IS902 family
MESALLGAARETPGLGAAYNAGAAAHCISRGLLECQVSRGASYCGLCGEEKSSADKLMRTPLSKQRNKHIQRVLVEAAKLAPRQGHDLALVEETEKQKGNANRATLAVARKMVAYLLAVDRQGTGLWFELEVQA